jgi:hypothetical protein
MKKCGAKIHIGPRLLPFSEFSLSKTVKGGLQGYCKTCNKKAQRNPVYIENAKKKVLQKTSPFLVKESSIQKDALRLAFYAQVGRQALLKKTHIIITGSGEDVRVLQKYGVPASNILACDTDRKAGKNFEGTRYEGIEDTVAFALVELGPGAIGSINVDLCMTVHCGCPILANIVQMCDAFYYRGPISFTFLRGRDSLTDSGRHLMISKAVGARSPIFGQYMSWGVTSLGSPMGTVFC